MGLHPLFKLRTEPTEGIIQLLESVSLGTNGAHYRHLDTRTRIRECDNPLFLSLERNEKVIGNITFLQRDANWYIRYFAFDPFLQGGGKVKAKAKGEGLLKRNIEEFFQEAFQGKYGEKVSHFYAYIDPRNAKSLWMSEQFNFKTIGRIATQSYSRKDPKRRLNIEKVNDWSEVKDLVEDYFRTYNFYVNAHTSKAPFYLLRDENGEILAFTKTIVANWKIERLPGKFGTLLVKVIPYIPGLRKLIRPSSHRFLVPEAVYIKGKDPQLFSAFFESILAMEGLNLALWWVDEKDALYGEIKEKVRWGLLHRLVGVPEANVVVRSNPDIREDLPQKPVFTTGFDFV